jgi:hypothetical protein
MRFNFSNFGNLPILAKKLWKVPKYLPDIPKIVEIYRPEFKVHCIFTHNTNTDGSFFTIKSDFIFMSDKYHLEESCKFTNYRKEKIQLNYSFIEKNQEEQMFIFEKEIGILPINIQNVIKKVENLLDENKDKCIVS